MFEYLVLFSDTTRVRGGVSWEKGLSLQKSPEVLRELFPVYESRCELSAAISVPHLPTCLPAAISPFLMVVDAFPSGTKSPNNTPPTSSINYLGHDGLSQ